MNFYVVEPEVAGGWGNNTVVDRSVSPVRITHLDYQFDGWSGDELLKTHPVYICATGVGEAILSAGFSGFQLADMEVSKSAQFRQLFPRRKLPSFRWLQITGEAEHDGLGLRSNKLVVSEPVLACLRTFALANARVRPVAEFEWDPEKHTEALFAEAKAMVDEILKKREMKQ